VNRALRYAVSGAVGLAVAAAVLAVSDGDELLVVTLPIVYGATTSYTLNHWRSMLELSVEDDDPPRLTSAAVGGIGALVLGLLLQTSVPAGVAAIGLYAFGTVTAVIQTMLAVERSSDVTRPAEPVPAHSGGSGSSPDERPSSGDG
jgi:hypothetical protein